MSSDVKVAEERTVEIAPLVYRPAPGWVPLEFATGTAARGTAATVATGGLAPEKAAEEVAVAHEREILERAYREGFAKGRAEADALVGRQQERITQLVQEFGRDREKYFHHVEGEVVALALAIVRKILRREAQTDPLLLAGLVRVALEKMADNQNVRLRVHPAQIPVWQEYFAQRADMPIAPELLGDAALAQDQCQLESQHDVTDLNLETQLKEIEQGLLDLLAQRPAPK
jgi:flagellar assembly protein FliH